MKAPEELENEMAGLFSYIDKRLPLFSKYCKEISGALINIHQDPKGVNVDMLRNIALQAEYVSEIIDRKRFPLDAEYLDLLKNSLARMVKYAYGDLSNFN